MSAMRKLSQFEEQPIEWLIPGMIPRGRAVLVSGQKDQGKSTWTAWLAAQVTSKLGQSVIYSNHEDDPSISKARISVAGGVVKRVFVPDEPYMLPRDVEALERKIKQTRSVLVVMDAASQHFNVSLGSGQEIRKAMTPLRAMLQRTGCSAVFVDHLLKKSSGQDDPLASFAGASSGLVAAVRLAYAFGRNPKDPAERVLAAAKANEMREKPAFMFEMDSAAHFTRDGREIEVGKLELLGPSPIDAAAVVAYTYRGGDKKADALRGTIAKEWLIGCLMFGSKLAKQVEDDAKDAGFAFRTLQRQAEEIGVKRNRVDPVTLKPKSGKGSAVLWSLPDTHPALLMAAKMGGQATATAS